MNNQKLLPPCTYQGGKQRFSKQIIDIMFEQNEVDNNTQFYDLCSASGSISIELINRGINPKNITMVDKSTWGVFYKSIAEGIFDIDKLKECINKIPTDRFKMQDYIKELASQHSSIDKEYKYIILQASSFGGKQVYEENGKWINCGFRNYWQPTETSIRRSPVNPIQPMPSVLLERVENLVEQCKGINCINDYIDNIDFNFDDNSIIYIDHHIKILLNMDSHLILINLWVNTIIIECIYQRHNR